MRITCDPAKRRLTLAERGLDMRRAKEIFAGLHLTRPDDRYDYGEPRFITVGWLDERLLCVDTEGRGPPLYQHEALS